MKIIALKNNDYPLGKEIQHREPTLIVKMTSKEALKMLETRCRFYAGDKLEIEETYEARETIEKDIEVLDIIKTHKLLNYVLKNKKCANMYKLMDDEIALLKEWLEK